MTGLMQPGTCNWPRFAAITVSNSDEPVRAKLKKRVQEQLRKPINRTVPTTEGSRKAKLLKPLSIVLATTALWSVTIAAGSWLVGQYRHFSGNTPSIALNTHNMIEAASTYNATILSNKNQVSNRIEFQKQFDAFTQSLITQLQASNVPKDQALGNELQAQQKQFEAFCEQLTNRFFQWARGHGISEGYYFSRAIKDQFFKDNPVAKDLSESQVEQLSNALGYHMGRNETVDRANFNAVKLIFKSFFNNGVQDVDISQMIEIKDKDQAFQYLDTLLSQPKTWPGLSQEARTGIIERSKAILANAEYPFNSRMPWTTHLFLLLTILGGGATVAFTKVNRRSWSETLDGIMDSSMMTGLKRRMASLSKTKRLILLPAGQDNQETLQKIKTQIEHQCQEIQVIQTKAMTHSPEIRQFFDVLIEKNYTPSTNSIESAFATRLESRLLAEGNGKNTMDELAYFRALQKEIEQSIARRDFLPQLDIGMLSMTTEPFTDLAGNQPESSEQQVDRLNDKIGLVLLHVINHQISQIDANQAFAKQDTLVRDLEKQAKRDTSSTLAQTIKVERQKLESLQGISELSNRLAASSQSVLSQLEEQRLGMQLHFLRQQERDRHAPLQDQLRGLEQIQEHERTSRFTQNIHQDTRIGDLLEEARHQPAEQHAPSLKAKLH